MPVNSVETPNACLRTLHVTLAVVLVALTLPLAAAAQGAGNESPQEPQTPSAPSAHEPRYPRIAIGTLTYLQYAAELENRDEYNAFDVTRGYINIAGDIAKNVKFRLTPDVRRITDGQLAGSLGLRLKYGYIEFDELTPGSWLRFGLHQTPWLDFQEGVNRYRVQGTMFAEREGIIPGSSDFGAGYLTRLPSQYGEINIGVYNGEGFAEAEVDEHKSVQVRVTIRPLPRWDGAGTHANGLRASFFYDAGWFADDLPRRHGIAMVSYEHQHFVGTAEWLAGTRRPSLLTTDTNFNGYSVFGELRQGMQGWAGFGRYESFDPDDHASSNSHRRAIAGVAYWLVWSAVRIGLVLNDEDVGYDINAARMKENRLMFQTHIQF